MTSHPHNPAATAEAFDELDPHGFDKSHGHDHGHVIVGPFTLRAVLGALLFFTVLTVFLAQAEVWAQNYFHIELPWWVNVAGAMSIAVIKAALVMAFFMQLKYDNPINTVLMCFCLAALAIFLSFTGMDLFNRGAVDPMKQSQVIAGGTYAAGKPEVVGAADRMVEYLAVTGTLNDRAQALSGESSRSQISPTLRSLASDIRLAHRSDALAFATESLKKFETGADKATSDEYAKVAAALKADTPEAREAFGRMREIIHRAHGEVETPEPTISTASQSRPKTGLSDALSATAPNEENTGETSKAEPEKHADVR